MTIKEQLSTYIGNIVGNKIIAITESSMSSWTKALGPLTYFSDVHNNYSSLFLGYTHEVILIILLYKA